MESNTTARIFKIERLNTHNGPGYRTVLFFKGCPLHCTWCHNPEGICRPKDIWFIPAKCIRCGSCIAVCPENALSFGSCRIEIDREKCSGCFRCVDECPTTSIEQIGTDVSVDDLMEGILKDKMFFDTSGGGITVTGGEPGIYPEFIAELFCRCREYKIQTAFDTSGAVPLRQLEKVLTLTDILYLDFKIANPELLFLHTGLMYKQLETSVDWLKEFKVRHPLSIRIRTPLIPEVTDNPENLRAIAGYILEIGENIVDEWELCPYNGLCADKYEKLGQSWTIQRPGTGWEMSTEFRQFLKRSFKKLVIYAPGYP